MQVGGEAGGVVAMGSVADVGCMLVPLRSVGDCRSVEGHWRAVLRGWFV